MATRSRNRGAPKGVAKAKVAKAKVAKAKVAKAKVAKSKAKVAKTPAFDGARRLCKLAKAPLKSI